MENKNAIIAAVVAVIVIVAAVGIYYGMNNGNDGGDETPTGDKYYFYLDGMGDLDGWYTANGSDAEVALKAALDEADLEYEVSSGFVNKIGDYINNIENKFFGTYVYIANTTEDANGTYFITGPALNQIDGNIVYITYGTYTYDETFGLEYSPGPINNADLFTTGPFASDDYQALDYGDEYWFYLDGMGDLDGWYTANGSNAELALKVALDEAGIEYSISNGWISNLGNLVEEGKYFGTYVFTSNSTEDANGSMFATGPVLDDITGNIVYVTFSGYQINADWRTVYDLNPMNTTSDMMTTGPFATA